MKVRLGFAHARRERLYMTTQLSGDFWLVSVSFAGISSALRVTTLHQAKY
ncbi:hypothetical protein [Gloeocapsopsis sp. IPPAS B-1203]|nr:hypothetical protein [Gloeocapsopsis sp. IPPAS B-1203]